MKRYQWIDGPPAISRIGAPGQERVERGGTIHLTATQLGYYRGRGFRFKEVRPATPVADRKEQAAIENEELAAGE